jgi:hypothetical protein
MGNGSTDIDPFVPQLVSLAFINDSFLELVLSQSAAQRALESDGAGTIAQTYYNRSVRRLQETITSYVDGSEKSPLGVILGALTDHVLHRGGRYQLLE